MLDDDLLEVLDVFLFLFEDFDLLSYLPPCGGI